MKIVVVFYAMLMLFALNSCKYFKEHSLFKKRGADTLLLDMTDGETDSLIVDTTEIIFEEPDMNPVQETPISSFGYGSDKYYMIVGSFQNQNFAEFYAEKIQQMGYQTNVIESSNGFYRVSAKSYSDFQLAVSEINDFRNSLSSNAWLHIRKQ